jgi:hypothetical protein
MEWVEVIIAKQWHSKHISTTDATIENSVLYAVYTEAI